MTTKDVRQINVDELKIGDIALVRSHNVNEFGDHYIVVVGGLVQKPHGLRPETVAIPVTTYVSLLFDIFSPVNGVTLLLLLPEARQEFIDKQNYSAQVLNFFNH